MKHLADGEDFGPSHFSKDFGFHGSAEGSGRPHTARRARGGSAAPPYAADEPTRGPKHVAEPMEDGGGDYARGGAEHPHGHHVVHVEQQPDGSVVHHHAHGGFTVHHARGGVSHHMPDGGPAMAHGGHHMAQGAAVHAHPQGHHVTHVAHVTGAEVHHHAHGGYTLHHDDGRVTHHHPDGSMAQHGMARGGHEDPDAAADKVMIERAVRQHENHEHDGEHTDLHLARGGMMTARLPRDLKPVAARHRSPIETPPRNPHVTTTPRNTLPAGNMAYGVEPSAEPDMAGSDQAIPQMRRGGRHKAR